MRKERTLQQQLSTLTRKELDKLTKMYPIKGKSKLKKLELAEVLTLEMKKDQYIRELIVIIEELKLAMKEQGFSDEYIKDRIPSAMWGLGYAFFDLKDTDSVYEVASDIKELINNFDINNITNEVKRYHLLRNVLTAANNLYGVYEISFFIELFNNLFNDVEPLDYDELSKYLKLCKKSGSEIGTSENYIASNSLFIVESDFEGLRKVTEEKDYYIPTKDELMRYRDSDYFEKTKQYTEFEEVIYKKLKNKERAEEIAEIIGFNSKFKDVSIEYMSFEFKVLGIEFADKKEEKEFLEAYVNLYNNTRVWQERGFKLNEIGKPLSIMPVKKEVAVGRNEPCPCGSGKKYKKCCLGK